MARLMIPKATGEALSPYPSRGGWLVRTHTQHKSSQARGPSSHKRSSHGVRNPVQLLPRISFDIGAPDLAFTL